MIVRVSVVDAERAITLMQRIRSEVAVDEVHFEQERQQVRIEVEKNRDETLVEVLNLLESWLGADGLPPTNVEIDDHRYLLGAAS